MLFFHGWDAVLAARITQNAMLQKSFVFLLNHTARILVLSSEFKTTLVHMGVDAHRVIVSRTMIEVGSVTAENPGKYRSILFLSRFDRRKGCYELLEAFARIAAEFPDCHLIMAGDGAENVALQQRASELNLHKRVSFPGYVSGQAKADLLRQCRLFALPTYYPEGMPLAVLEAMAVGKPLLTTPVGGLRQTVSEPENGVILEEVTVDTVTAGLRRLLRDATFCAEAGQRNAVAARHFDAAVVSAEIESIYHDIANLK